MDEPTPWGASDDLPTFPPRQPSPKLPYSPPAASALFSAPSWQDDSGGGWGSAVDDYVPGAFGTGFGTGDAESKADDRDSEVVPPLASPSYNGGASGWTADSPELPRFTANDSNPSAGIVDGAVSSELQTSPPLSPVPLPPPQFSSYAADDTFEPQTTDGGNGDDAGGWGGAEPDLPPLGALRIAAEESTLADDSRDDGWGPAQEEADLEEEEPPLPSIGDLFPSAVASRRQSAELAQKGEQGEDAWGSSQGWEERMRLEAEAREQQRIAEAKAAGIEPEEERKPNPAPEESSNAADKLAADDKPAAKSGLASIFRFRKTAEETAAQAVETAKETTANAARGAAALARSASSRPSSEQEGARASGEAERPAAKSWLSRVAAGKEDPSKAASEDDDPSSLGVEEVQQGESGRTASPEPQQGSVFGRLFGRKKAPASDDTRRSAPTSARNSGDQQSSADMRVQDLDALGDTKLVARLQAQSQANKSKYDYDEDEDDIQPAPQGSFFGSRNASTSRVPSAPPEDDFGGLIGAFSAAPSTSGSKSKAPATAFDPFDPLSDNFGAISGPKPVVASRPATASTLARPAPQPATSTSRTGLVAPPRPLASAQVASFGSPPRATSAPASGRAASTEDDFDAFFDSVAVSTGHKAAARPAPVAAPPARSVAHPGAPPSASVAHSRNLAGAKRVVSPPPRLSVSPPVRVSTASPLSASSGRTTPIMPLAPPPPPSQPLAANRLVGLDAPPAPAAVSQTVQHRVPSPAMKAPLAPAPALSPALAPSAKPRTPSPQPPQSQPQAQRAPSGPLSLDDLSFFES